MNAWNDDNAAFSVVVIYNGVNEVLKSKNDQY